MAQQKRKPGMNSSGSNKNKSYKALNMRQPAGASILELQQMEKTGHLQKHEIGEDNYAGDMLYSFEDKFTDIELEKFKEAFVFFDKDGDGTMRSHDVCLAMRAMGALVTEKEVFNLLKKYDPDNTGTIDVNDFIACMAEVVNKEDNPMEIKNAFSVFDKEDNGLLPIDEMRHVLTRIGDPLSQEEITNFLNILDINGDGFVRMNGLLNLLTPQTNKDIYAKTVGGEGIERSHMKEAKQQSGAELNSAPQSNQNSGVKRQRKAFRKQGQSDYSLTSRNGNDNFDVLANKYKDIPGACEWFQVKKLELESQKKSIAGLPLQHQWKPPRMDDDKYQIANIDQAIQQLCRADQPKNQDIDKTQSVNRLRLKRVRRSQSTDQTEDNYFPKKQVIYLGQPLLQRDEEPFKPIVEEEKREEVIGNLAYDAKNPENSEEKMKDYLELVEFIMRETNSSCNGVWLKGSLVGHIEKAMQLLHSLNYNYTLAKFHILYPSVMAIPERKEEILSSLTDKEMESIVTDAVIDLRGCKSQEAEEAIQNIRNALQHRITVEDLNYYQQVLKKLRVEMPQDIEQELQNSREFSKLIKKRCGPQTGGGAAAQIPNEKKMKMSELLNMQQESQGYCIITAEMQLLVEYVKRANQWIEKAELIKSQVVNVKQLQNLLLEARSIPVNFEQLIEDLKKRCNDAQALVEKIYNTFIKVTKTRTQVSSLLEQGTSKERKKQLELIKKEKKQKEQQFRDLLQAANELMITNPEVQKLKEHMDDVDQWKNRVMMFLEDDLEQRERKEVFSILLRETSLFKIEMDLTEDLQRRLEFIEWNEKVEKIYYLIFNKTDPRLLKKLENLKEDEEMKDQTLRSKVLLDDLQTIMQEGENKGFSELPLEPIQKVAEVCLKANQYQNDLRKILQQIKENKEKVKMERLLNLKEEGDNLMVQMEEIENLELAIKEAKQYENKCLNYINQSQQLNKARNEELKHSDQIQVSLVKEMLQLRQQIAKIGISNTLFTKFNKMIKPILIWIKYARLIIKCYYKSLDLQLSQLQLLEQQEVDSDESEEEEEEVKEKKPILDDILMEIDKPEGKSKFEIPNNDYEILLYLLQEAQEKFKILTFTNDFQVLKDIETRCNSWIEKVKELQLTSQNQTQVQIVETLEKLVNENLPLPLDKQQHVSKWLRRERWLKRLHELYNAEKVKMKQIETLTKDSNHADIQEDPKCKQEQEILKEQLGLCREWVICQLSSDLNSQKDITKLLEMGKSMKINLSDYVDLKSFFQDVIDWRDKTVKIFNDPKCEELNYEFVRKHIELGIQLDISDKEIDLLKNLVEMCAHWKSLARKILKSRELCKLEIQSVIIEQSLPSSQSDEDDLKDLALILQRIQKQDQISYKLEQIKGLKEKPTKENFVKKIQYFDNQQYCICRRGDDGLVFMIECDSCKEWFHGDCIGLAKNVGSKLQQYICIGCARVNFNFEPFSQSKSQDETIEGFDPDQLKIFTQQRRANYQFFKANLDEGENLPIYLEEMNEMSEINRQIEDWLLRIEPYLEMSIDEASQEQSSEIINTRTFSQVNTSSQKQNKEEDQVSKAILKLFLESESFPVEIGEAEFLVLIMKQRKWCQEAMKILNSQFKQNKVQQKKTIKKLIAQTGDLKVESDQKLMNIAAQLNSLLGQHSLLNAQQQNSQQYSQQQNQATVVETQLNALFKEQPVQYGNCISLIEYFEGNNFVETDEDKQKLEDLKQLLSTYSTWLSQVRECLNNGQKNQITEEFESMMKDGEKLFWMITSVEKEQYLQIYQMYNDWIITAKSILQQLDDPNIIFNDPESQNYYVSEVQQKYKQITAQQNIDDQQQVVPNDSLVNNILQIDENSHDFFK